MKSRISSLLAGILDPWLYFLGAFNRNGVCNNGGVLMIRNAWFWDVDWRAIAVTEGAVQIRFNHF
jgi:hypothetical protein